MLYFIIANLFIILFEIVNVYFIMPMPGSQMMDSIDLAYFLYSFRWLMRILFILLGIYGLKKSFSKRPIISSIITIITLLIVYFTNFEMAADKMFLQPNNLILKAKEDNKVDLDKLIIGVYENGKAKAYPIQYIAYHHQVLDSIDDLKFMVTYCSVCRTGRVFEPKIDNQYYEFRLVGMDHFNAMFEDEKTKSWWRQANGEAIAGDLKGTMLPEVKSYQMSLSKWLDLHPNSKIMQADKDFSGAYKGLEEYDSGEIKSKLVGTNKESWKDKSWVIGIKINNYSKAYDWNQLKKNRYILDTINNNKILLVLSNDEKSFNCFKIESNKNIQFENDIINIDSINYNLKGIGINTKNKLIEINAYQEFWHSWKTFNPNTLVYK